jgi:DNA-binding IclR family transcriptional regulator
MHETGLSLQTVQRELENLSHLGILKKRETKGRVYYQTNKLKFLTGKFSQKLDLRHRECELSALPDRFRHQTGRGLISQGAHQGWDPCLQ